MECNGGDKEREACKQQTTTLWLGPSNPWLPKEVEDLWRSSTYLDLDKWHTPPTQPFFFSFSIGGKIGPVQPSAWT